MLVNLLGVHDELEELSFVHIGFLVVVVIVDVFPSERRVSFEGGRSEVEGGVDEEGSFVFS